LSVARVHVVLLLGLLAGAAALVSRSAREGERTSAAPVIDEAAAILLPDAALFATLDVAALSRTRWGRSALSAALATSAEGEACADEEIRKIRRLAFALPFESNARRRSTETGVELALVAEGGFDATGASACAFAVLHRRGGEPARSHVNGFRVVRDRRGSGELAVRDGGPLIVSGGGYFRELLERWPQQDSPREHVALPGVMPSVQERLHRALRAAAAPAPLLATWVLPPGWLEGWLGDAELGRSPLGSIRALVIRGEATHALAFQVRLTAESAEAAAELEPFLRRLGAGAAMFLSQGAAPAPKITRAGATLDVRFTTEGYDLSRVRAAIGGGGPSHALEGADPQKPDAGTEHAAGGGAQ
jgi:hypothetical protein